MDLTAFIINSLGPPLPFIVMAMTGVGFFRWRFGRLVAYTGFGLLIVCFIPAGGILVSLPLISTDTSWSSKDLTMADAIVVPTGGYFFDDAKFWSGKQSLRRGNLAVKLQKETHLPLVLTGGATSNGGPAEAEVLSRNIDINQDSLIIERESTNTYEHAKYLKGTFDDMSVKTIILVTSAMHMARTAACFRAFGFHVIPVSANDKITDFMHRASAARYLLPSWEGITITRRAFYSYAGILFYWAKGRIDLSDLGHPDGAYLDPHGSWNQ